MPQGNDECLVVDLTQEDHEDEAKKPRVDNDFDNDITNLVSPDKPVSGNAPFGDDDDVVEIVEVNDEDEDQEKRQMLSPRARSKALTELLNLGRELRRDLNRKILSTAKQRENHADREPNNLGKRMETTSKEEVSVAPEATRKKKVRLTEEEKQVREAARKTAAERKKLMRQYESDRHVLKFLNVVLDPQIMTKPLGVALAQAFQNTHDKQEHEMINYKVASIHELGLPLVVWHRNVPQEDGNTEIEEEPFLVLCFEGKELADLILKDEINQLFRKLDGPMQEYRIHIVIHRLDTYLRQQERLDHKKSMSNTVNGEPMNKFSAIKVDRYLSKILIHRPDIEIFDVDSTEEACNHICALTRAVSMRYQESEGLGARYLAGRSRGRGGDISMTKVLTSHPLPDPEMRHTLAALCAIPSLGPSIAHAIVSKYKNLAGLYEMITNPLLADITKEKNLSEIRSTGGARKPVGPRVAKRIIELFTAENPLQLIHEEM